MDRHPRVGLRDFAESRLRARDRERHPERRSDTVVVSDAAQMARILHPRVILEARSLPLPEGRPRIAQAPLLRANCR